MLSLKNQVTLALPFFRDHPLRGRGQRAALQEIKEANFLKKSGLLGQGKRQVNRQFTF